MNRQVVLSCAAAVVFAWAAEAILASTNCCQNFTFIARTKGSRPVFWIAEDIGGQCSQSRLHQVAVVDCNASLTSSDLELQKSWDWLKQDMGRFRIETPLELVNTKDVWRLREANWHIKPPSPRPLLMAEFEQHVQKGGGNGWTWNRLGRSDGLMVPEMHNIKAPLIYYYPGGLYINYDISRAYYFPRSGYILVFTRQKRLAVGLDTMHGFLLFRRSQ